TRIRNNMLFAPGWLAALSLSCQATPSSLTPAGWNQPIPASPADAPRGPLRVVRDVSLPGGARRFDYQSVDDAARRLYITHMNDDHLVVVDLDSARVIANVGGVELPTGVWAVRQHHAV